jgi:hypothetical protein
MMADIAALAGSLVDPYAWRPGRPHDCRHRHGLECTPRHRRRKTAFASGAHYDLGDMRTIGAWVTGGASYDALVACDLGFLHRRTDYLLQTCGSDLGTIWLRQPGIDTGCCREAGELHLLGSRLHPTRLRVNAAAIFLRRSYRRRRRVVTTAIYCKPQRTSTSGLFVRLHVGVDFGISAKDQRYASSEAHIDTMLCQICVSQMARNMTSTWQGSISY